MAMLLSGIAANGQTEKRIYTSSEKERMAQQATPRVSKEKLSRAERREARAAYDSLNFEKSLKALNDLNFVLEADRIIFKRGESVYVSPTVNFISVTDDKAIVQVSPVSSGGGPNGVGGVTVEGEPSNINLRTDRHGNVTITPNLNSARLTLTGSIATPEESVVFKGRTF